MDYCFPGDEFDHRLMVLVVIKKYTKMKKAVVVPNNSAGRYAAKLVLELIDECGDKDSDIILKTDQEPAIKLLVDDIFANRTGDRRDVAEGQRGVERRP